ncbi:L,D-transpeptidase family protein [Lawsonia intracellularis]|uniref:L,D-transpeptidase family protein n=1 Tax=Lawsonia intracellularis TaxID=29546 RepID=UPI0011EBC77B|nr:L,D-transpeptidase family protein [Lawsonia intracellularis]KAA0205347.1 hypothetical protein C4K43_02460 [Lawsonia intracellularis]
MLKLFHTLLILFILIVHANAHDLYIVYKDNICQATLDEKTYKCSIGKNGTSNCKVEGDKSTPLGKFPLRKVFFREDKIGNNIKTGLPSRKIKKNDGWCDDPTSIQYNKFVDLTCFNNSISHEKLYRDDDVYDLIIVVGYNDSSPIPSKGSAIFIHVAREGFLGTDGCIAFAQDDLVEILSKLDKTSKVIIQ